MKKPLPNFGQRMKDLKEFRKAQQIEKLRRLINPFDTRIRPEIQIKAKNSLREPEMEIQKEQPRKPNDMVDRAIQRLREQARNLS